MNRSTGWCVPLATLALSTAAHAADPGFYFGATASRVEHDVEGRPGIAVFIAAPSPNPIFPPPVFGGRPPPGGVFNSRTKVSIPHALCGSIGM